MSAFLQWAGGKAKSIQQLSQYVPTRIRNYYEPFLGGGSMLLHVLSRADAGDIELSGRVIAGDVNEALILCFAAVKENPDGVVEAFERLCGAYEACPTADTCKKHYCVCGCQECMYHSVRTLFNIYKIAPVIPEVETAAMFLFLNATCYRGLYRESKAGAFNTCYWSSRPIFPKSERILEAGRLFQKYDVKFVATNYKLFWKDFLGPEETLHADDLIYLDPPFVKEAKPKKRREDDAQQLFLEADTEWIAGWVRTQARISENVVTTQPNVIWSTYDSHSAELPLMVKHAFTTHRSMMYKGATSIKELIITNM